MKYVNFLFVSLLFSQCTSMKNIAGELAKSVSIQHPNIQINASPQKSTKNISPVDGVHCFVLEAQQIYVDSFRYDGQTYIVRHTDVDFGENLQFILSFEDTIRIDEKSQAAVVYKRNVPVVKIDQ